MKKFFVERVMKARWIVSLYGELGIRVFGINLWYYKWPDPCLFDSNDSEYKHGWRYAEKREFGEVIKSERKP